MNIQEYNTVISYNIRTTANALVYIEKTPIPRNYTFEQCITDLVENILRDHILCNITKNKITYTPALKVKFLNKSEILLIFINKTKKLNVTKGIFLKFSEKDIFTVSEDEYILTPNVVKVYTTELNRLLKGVST